MHLLEILPTNFFKNYFCNEYERDCYKQFFDDEDPRYLMGEKKRLIGDTVVITFDKIITFHQHDHVIIHKKDFN